MGRQLKVMARARPGALPVPANRDVQALTAPSVLDRWADDAAGVRALATGDNVVTMFDMVGEDYWTGEGITAKRVAQQLRAIGERPVEVHLNSPGGDMFEGIAIYNVLREHPQEVTIKVMGWAASAASLIAMAGDRVEIGVGSFVMIHNAWVRADGNRHDMREVAEYLEPFDAAMAAMYAARTGRDVAEITRWMDAETYMSGTQAIERGFADALLPADAMVSDGTAKAAHAAVNDLRALELTLVGSGMTRTQARARINRIKGGGTPGAASTSATPGAGDDEWAGLLASLTQTIQS